MKIAFFGLPSSGAPFLRHLLEQSRHSVVLVCTSRYESMIPGRDFLSRLRKAKRNVLGWIHPTTVEAMAKSAKIEIVDSIGMVTKDLISWLADFGVELGVVATFNRILSQPLLDATPLGFINVHPSLLPEHRGRDPLFWTLVKGDTEFGITIHRMVAQVDAGAILKQARFPINPGDTYSSLMGTFYHHGPSLLLATLDDIDEGKVQEQIQDEGKATYDPPVNPREMEIDWKDPSLNTIRLVRACDAWGGVWADLAGWRCRIKRVEVAESREASALPYSAEGSIWVHQDYAYIRTQDGWLKLLEVFQATGQPLVGKKIAGKLGRWITKSCP